MSFLLDEGQSFVIASPNPDWIVSQLFTLWFPGFAVTRIDVSDPAKLGCSDLKQRMMEAHMSHRTLLCVCLPSFFKGLDNFNAFTRTTGNLIIEAGVKLTGHEALLFDELSTVIDSQDDLADMVDLLKPSTALFIRNIATLRASMTIMFK